MKLAAFRLHLHGTWVTPWQSDTLMGMLACVHDRMNGLERLESDLLAPWRADPPRPPFVLSDAFPGDLLPAPASLALMPGIRDAKRLKRIEWLAPEEFRAAQTGGALSPPKAVLRPVHRFLRLRNVLDRSCDSTGESGNLYGVPLSCLEEEYKYLTVYAKVAEEHDGLLSDLLKLLAKTGFGADAGVGQGQFDVEKAEVGPVFAAVEKANGWISLSTFQPAATDPTDGFWRSFLKYGKLGPELGVETVFKRPQWMMRPGAVFRSVGAPNDWYGRAIPTDQLLGKGTLEELGPEGVRPVQPAFALAMPAVFPIIP